MEKKRLRYLLEQHLADKATAEEQQELSSLLKADTHPDLFKAIVAEMMQREIPALPANQNSWQKMAEDIVAIDRSAPKQAIVVKRRFSRPYRWAAAAVLLLIAGAVTYFITSRPSSNNLAGQNNIAPAVALKPGNANKLTLPDGSHIMLDDQKDGVIVRLGTITVTKQNKQIIYTGTGPVDGGYHTLSTARGSNYDVIMADGSQVSLNAASSLRFSDGFSVASRFVELAGEAWFDVHHADRLPFSIRSGEVTTTVLGTAFDIKAYPDQKNMTIAVQRGKVKVETGNKTLATLVKGQQVILNSAYGALEQQIDALSVGAWKQGNLNYEDEALHSIVADLQRVFNDSVSIQNANIKDIRITVRGQKKEGIQHILTMICSLSDSRLTRKDGIFIIE